MRDAGVSTRRQPVRCATFWCSARADSGGPAGNWSSSASAAGVRGETPARSGKCTARGGVALDAGFDPGEIMGLGKCGVEIGGARLPDRNGESAMSMSVSQGHIMQLNTTVMGAA